MVAILAELALRQAGGNATGAEDLTANEVPECQPLVSSWDDQSLRIGAVFILLVASLIGALSPMYLAKWYNKPMIKKIFFIVKYLGTGVIISTAFLHL